MMSAAATLRRFGGLLLLASTIASLINAASANSDSAVALHDLPGRPLHVRASHADHGDIFFASATASSASEQRRDGAAGAASFKQYLVRVSNHHPAELFAQLQEASKGHQVEYVPDVSVLYPVLPIPSLQEYSSSSSFLSLPTHPAPKS